MNHRAGQRGMSLIEILVAIGILGIVTAGMSTYMVQMQRSQQILNAKANVTSLVNAAQMLLGINARCSSAFKPSSTSVLNQFNLITSQGTTAGSSGQEIRLQLSPDQVIGSDYTRDGYVLRRLYIQSDSSSTNLASGGGNHNYLVKVMANFEVINPSNPDTTMPLAPMTLGQVIIETTGENGSIEGCMNTNQELVRSVCIAMRGTFANGECTLPPPTATSLSPDQLEVMCTSLGGTFSGGSCSLPTSGSSTTSSSSPSTTGSSTTLSTEQLQTVCSSISGTFSGGRCVLPTTTTEAILPVSLRGCQGAAPACGRCLLASCTSAGWACTWDFRGGCMGYWEDSF